MKVLKHKNILGLIYGVLLMIPFFSVLGRSAYVTMNKNAFQSYSGTTYQEIVSINYETNQPTSNNDLYVDYAYKWTNSYNEFISGYVQYLNVKVYDIYGDLGSTFDTTLTYTFYTENTFIYLRTVNTSSVISISSKNFVFVITSLNNQDRLPSTFYTHLESYNKLFKEYVEVTQQVTLDNAFEYSLKEITNNDIGKVKFFTWFADMFVDVNNGKSAIYVGFINWYFNYSLLVSLGFVLYAVLMWFINWIRRLLEKGQDFGQGGF